MKRFLLAAALALAASAAFAGGSHDTKLPPRGEPAPPPFPTIDNRADASATAGAASDAWVVGPSVSADSRYYVFPGPVAATPLPANLCPQNDSLAWSFGWNLVSYATSTVRTDMACLERVAEWMRATARPLPVLQGPAQPPAACKPVAAPRKAHAKPAARPRTGC